MEHIASDIGVVLGGLIVAYSFYFVGKFSKNLFPNLTVEQKKKYCLILIYVLSAFGMIIYAVNNTFIKVACGVISALGLIFLVLLATNLAFTNKK